MAKRRLGRGLSTLLGNRLDEAAEEEAIVDEVSVDLIRPNPSQPRMSLSEESLEGLVESVRREGVLQPVVLRELEDGHFELVAGERRWRAAQRAGLATIPAVVRDVPDDRLLELALIENVQRENLNPIEQAKAYRQVMTALQLTQEETAARLGLQRSTLANSLRLLELPGELQDLVSRGTITAGHARAILSIADPALQMTLVKRIIGEGLSVRAAENAAAMLLGRKAADERIRRPKAPHIRELETQLKMALGTEVVVRERRRGGRIVIDFKSHDDFERILGALGVKLENGL